MTFWISTKPVSFGVGNVIGENIVAENPDYILPNIEVAVFTTEGGTDPVTYDLDLEACGKFALCYCLEFMP